MASSEYFRKQAQIFAGLALAADNEAKADLYNGMALEYLAKAEELEPSDPMPQPHTIDGSEANSTAE